MIQFITVTVGAKSRPYTTVLATRDILAVNAKGNFSGTAPPTLDAFLAAAAVETAVFDHEGVRYSVGQSFRTEYHRVDQGVIVRASEEEYNAAKAAYVEAMRAEWTNTWEDRVNVNCAQIICENLKVIPVHETLQDVAAKLGAL